MWQILNWLALSIPFIAAGVAWLSVEERRWPKSLSFLAGATVFALVIGAYFPLYQAIGFPAWMRWIAQVREGLPLPGNPNVLIDLKVEGDWRVVGMNYDWMMLVAKPDPVVASKALIMIRREFVKQQNSFEGKRYLSEAAVGQVDCAVKKMAMLSGDFYPLNNLTGEPVETVYADINRLIWTEYEPKSFEAEAIRLVCDSSDPFSSTP